MAPLQIPPRLSLHPWLAAVGAGAADPAAAEEEAVAEGGAEAGGKVLTTHRTRGRSGRPSLIRRRRCS